jgi:hypothetical protein
MRSQGVPLIYPVGTQVVVRSPVAGRDRLYPAGAVAVVIHAPADTTHAYRVRFPDGFETSLRAAELAVRKQTERPELLESTEEDEALFDHVFYRCVVGSRAYGLADDLSDTDRRGIYLPPADRQWSLAGAPEQLERSETQECYWEVRKFLLLALRANPTVLECLYTPLVELATPLASELRKERSRFLSRLIYQTYNGYVLSQFKWLEADLRNRGEARWKHAMHLVRLLIAGVSALREGDLPLLVTEDRERLLAIRRGALSWEEVDAWRVQLHAQFDAALPVTRLPERPDVAWANDFLIRARRSALQADVSHQLSAFSSPADG